MAINFFFIMRILIGCVFVVSGFEKLVSPHQNFLYVVQGYALFGAFLEHVISYVMPWIEFLLGVFLVLGLWTKWILRGMFILTAMFIVVVAQAIIRKLSIVECGCFGDFLAVPLHMIVLFDSIMLLVIHILLRKEDRANAISLDRYFAPQK